MGDEQDEVDFSISDDELDASPDKVLGYAELLANPKLLLTLDTNSDEGWRQFSDSIVHFIGLFAGTKSKLQKSVDELTARNEKLVEEMDRLQQPSVLTGKQTSASKFPKFPAIDNSRASLTSIVWTTSWPWRKIPSSTLLSPSIRSCGPFMAVPC